MTFFEARALGMHVRRTAWSDPNQWFIIWRGLWWFFTTGTMRPVQAADYTSTELLATDWTTVPEALAACVVNPTTGSTGGAPPSNIGGFLAELGNGGSIGGSGGYGGGGSGSGGTPTPPPDPGTGLSVTIAGTTAAAGGPNINGTFTLSGSGTSWSYTGGGLSITVSRSGSTFSASVEITTPITSAESVSCPLGVPTTALGFGLSDPWLIYESAFPTITINAG